ncbi:hypothetical protein Droror1_Dr00017869 [Drosera rotundifolia]
MRETSPSPLARRRRSSIPFALLIAIDRVTSSTMAGDVKRGEIEGNAFEFKGSTNFESRWEEEEVTALCRDLIEKFDAFVLSAEGIAVGLFYGFLVICALHIVIFNG